MDALLAKGSAVKRCSVLPGQAKDVESNNCIIVIGSSPCPDQNSLAVQYRIARKCDEYNLVLFVLAAESKCVQILKL